MTTQQETPNKSESLGNLQDAVLGFFERNPQPVLFSTLAKELDVPRGQWKLLGKTLEQMEKPALIYCDKQKRYGPPAAFGLHTGHIMGNPRGFGFFVPEDGTADAFVGPRNLMGAMHMDRVLCEVFPSQKPDQGPEGKVLRILERANVTVVGTYLAGSLVTADNPKIADGILVSPDDALGATAGDKVVTEIIKYPTSDEAARGRVIEVLGAKGDVGVDVLSIIRSYSLPEAFPPPVKNAASRVKKQLEEGDAEGREDLRDLMLFTIDGADAKDLDDAVSLETTEDGLYRLGVHIADVSHYVRTGSVLDQEAYKRGTSVYLADRVIPMLPEQLSNGICSLNPDVDRLAFSAFMEINDQGEVLSCRLTESVIHSKARLTYSEVSQMLKGGDPELIQRRQAVYPTLKAMEQLCHILREKRTRRGSVDFEFDEAKIILDDQGHPVDIQLRENDIANQLIEEFMLCANESVAKMAVEKKIPIMYRVHELPDPDKLSAFGAFLAGIGLKLPGANLGKVDPKQLQQLLGRISGTDQEAMISRLMLRSLQKARYCEENLGHYALAADNYCHFTSPIRRYPDLVTHRALKRYLHGGLKGKGRTNLVRMMPEMAQQCSLREKQAMEAERAVDDLKKAEYMADHVGESFDGVVSGVTAYGYYVALPNTVEGMVRLQSLEQPFQYDEDHYCLIGASTGRRITLGDKVRIRVLAADLINRRVDFEPDNEQERGTPMLRATGARQRPPMRRPQPRPVAPTPVTQAPVAQPQAETPAQAPASTPLSRTAKRRNARKRAAARKREQEALQPQSAPVKPVKDPITGKRRKDAPVAKTPSTKAPSKSVAKGKTKPQPRSAAMPPPFIPTAGGLKLPTGRRLPMRQARYEEQMVSKSPTRPNGPKIHI